MEYSRVLLVIIVAVILLGFVLGIVKTGYTACTEMACGCPPNESEIKCNSCYSHDPVFMLGIVNVVKSCSGDEILVCYEGKIIDTRIDMDESSCQYRVSFFS